MIHMTSLDAATRLDAIIKTAIDGIITIDDQGIVEEVNNAALTLFGYEPAEVLGLSINKLIPYPDRKHHDSYMEAYKKTRKAKIIGMGRELEGLKKSGRTFPLRLVINEVVLTDRTVFTGIIHDLTDVKEAERKLIEANNNLETQVEMRTQEIEDVVNELLKTNRKLEQSQLETFNALHKEKKLNELKSRFVSMASHEFRTPLSTILSSASLIKRYTDLTPNDKVIKHVERIKLSVKNLTGILDDFLSLGKLEEGRIEVVLREVDVEELCTEVSLEINELLKEGQKIVKTSVGIPKAISTDPRILKNIMINLASNAIKYSKEDGIIECKKTYGPDSFEISYTDSGIGIPDADQENLFERFFRATNVENIQGTGLGLNIVKSYVDLLEGEVSFKSKVGIGSTFTVKLNN